jgi:metacaspase-1
MGVQKEGKSKTKGLSLHVGLNSVDPKHYSGWSGELCACEFDAKDMASIAKSKGMGSTVLLTKDASRSKVKAGLRNAAKTLGAGDFFFLTYSGHGGQVKDVTGEEPDKKDETWCLFDGELIDDELFLELGRFKAGVRILVLSDSCHSGTVTRAAYVPPPSLPEGKRSKMMPPPVAARVYRENREFYDELQRDVASDASNMKAASAESEHARVAESARLARIAAAFDPAVILISGCQDNQTSLDGDYNGAFTEQLLAVWNDGEYVGTYAKFAAEIRARLPKTQTPNLFTLGDARAFLRDQVFNI